MAMVSRPLELSLSQGVSHRRPPWVGERRCRPRLRPAYDRIYLHTRSIRIAALLWGTVAALYSVGVLHLFQVVKVPVPYERVGLRHTRTMKLNRSEVYGMVATGLSRGILGTKLADVAFLFTTVAL